MHISEQKSQLRDSIKERLLRMNDQERESESRSLCRRLLPVLPTDTAVCGYMPLPSEANIMPLLEEVLKRGTPLYLPVFERNTLIFRRCTDLSSLEKGELGIREPTDDMEPLKDDMTVTILVPGRAFDAKGNRLGRGNGGYDRWIDARRKNGGSLTLIGVALDHQMVPQVPVEPHDSVMDIIVTPRTVITPSVTDEEKSRATRFPR